jgi:hypothetical protein
MKKPDKCCECGSYEHQITMPINGKVQCIDLCISHIVAALNAGNIQTVNSCCGHGKMFPSIILEDGRYLVIMDKIKFDKMCRGLKNE